MPTNSKNDFLQEHGDLLIKSFYRQTGRHLIANTAEDTAENTTASPQLFDATFAVVSHGTEAVPIFNYANRLAQSLFEMPWSEFTALPSSKSAEAVSQAERDRLLKQVSKHGYIDNYQGIRISASGRRFKIEDAIVWNIIDAADNYCGQAAVLYRWVYLTGQDQQ